MEARILIFVFVCLLLVIPCQGRIITVDDEGIADFNNIQAAIDDSNDGDTIEVKIGTYTGNGNRDIDFKGKAITVRGTDPNDPNVVANTIIDCNATEAQQHRGFYFHSGEDVNSILAGITITRGYVADPPKPNRGPYQGGAIFCDTGVGPTISRCIIRGNTAISGGGIYCKDSHSTISHCLIQANRTIYVSREDGGGGISCGTFGYGSDVISNCIITGNVSLNGDHGGMAITAAVGGGISVHSSIDSSYTIRNCTIVGNKALNKNGGRGGGIHDDWGSSAVMNCIIWDNVSPVYTQVWKPSLPFPSYCDIEEQEGPIGYVPGEGTYHIDPCFVNPGYWDSNDVWVEGEYHLKSQAGRWDPNCLNWVHDSVTSPCIDAGDPNSDWTAELWPHGKRINMGAYGGTPEASMSLSGVGNIADFNKDGNVNYLDTKLLAERWLSEEVLLAEDTDRNGAVNLTDFAIFADNWRWEE